MACLVLHNFLSLRDEELAEAIAKTVREEAGPNNGPRNAQSEPSHTMKQERLRDSLRKASHCWIGRARGSLKQTVYVN